MTRWVGSKTWAPPSCSLLPPSLTSCTAVIPQLVQKWDEKRDVPHLDWMDKLTFQEMEKIHAVSVVSPTPSAFVLTARTSARSRRRSHHTSSSTSTCSSLTSRSSSPNLCVTIYRPLCRLLTLLLPIAGTAVLRSLVRPPSASRRPACDRHPCSIPRLHFASRRGFPLERSRPRHVPREPGRGEASSPRPLASHRSARPRAQAESQASRRAQRAQPSLELL